MFNPWVNLIPRADHADDNSWGTRVVQYSEWQTERVAMAYSNGE